MIRRGCYLFLGVMTAVSSAADSWAQRSDSFDGKPLSPSVDSRFKPALLKMEPKFDSTQVSLQTTPSRADKQVKLTVGVEEKNLLIEWDDWHNEVARAVASRMFTNLGEALNMPRGITTWYHFEATSDRHIKKVEITRSSGNIWYDRAVRDAVLRLEGQEILAFPARSARTEVAGDLGIRLGGAKTGYMRLGDVEYHEVTPEQGAPDDSPGGSATRSTKEK